MSIQHNNSLRLFVILSLTFGCLFVTSGGSKCDINIINGIRTKFWNNGKCIPEDLLRTGAYMSPGATVRATKNFFPNEENITCVFGDYRGSVILVYADYNNNSCPPELILIIVSTEEPGIIYDPATGEIFYHLYSNRFGVTVFYVCKEIDDVGDPVALIKVSARRGFDEKAVLQACEDLASLGIHVSDKFYDISCAL